MRLHNKVSVSVSISRDPKSKSRSRSQSHETQNKNLGLGLTHDWLPGKDCLSAIKWISKQVLILIIFVDSTMWTIISTKTCWVYPTAHCFKVSNRTFYMIFVWKTSCFYRNCTKFSEHERSTLNFNGLPQKAPKIMLYALKPVLPRSWNFYRREI